VTQTLAIFHDAYRCLNAKRMFWIVLVLSALVVFALAGVGIDERGVSVLWWTFESQELNTRLIPREAFYKMAFLYLGLDYWVTWIAAVLALVSTAGIFPDFISSGSVDLVLSKPIGRLRLFLTQYAGGLLFVTLQVAVFSVGAFLVIGLRGGAWEPVLFLAVPVVVVFFSYLFSVCVCLGVMLRSTVAALLLTLVFWMVLSGANVVDSVATAMKVSSERSVETVQARIDANRSEIARRQGGTGDAAEPPGQRSGGGANAEGAGRLRVLGPTRSPQAMTESELREEISRLERLRDRHRGELRFAESFQGTIVGIKTFLPKTNETVALLERAWLKMVHLPLATEARRAHEERRARSVGWVMGTSLAFEAVILALGAWVFCRRDF
jgi:ABC-type transport system involved in multi-copper enzyme maturation permease subunit